MIPRRDPIEELSLLLQRPPPRQFVTSALSISSPGGASAKWKGKQRAEAPPPIVDPSRLSLPPIEVDDPIPSSPRIPEEDELSSDEEPLARTHRQRMPDNPPRIPVNPPVILPDMHYAIPEKPPDSMGEDEIISILDSDNDEDMGSDTRGPVLRPQDAMVHIEGHQQRDKMRRVILRGSIIGAGGLDSAFDMYTVSMHGVVNRLCGDPLRCVSVRRSGLLLY